MSRGRHRGSRALFAALTAAERRDVGEILGEDHAAEIRMARQLAAHAPRLGRYPDRRARLLEIGAREEEHARWLREARERLGGRPPERTPSPPDARTNWERLVTDLEAEKAAVDTLIDDAYTVERDHPDIARLLRIAEEESHHQRELARMLGRSERFVLDRATLDVVTRRDLAVDGRSYTFWSLGMVEERVEPGVRRLPVVVRLLLGNLLRHVEGPCDRRGPAGAGALGSVRAVRVGGRLPPGACARRGRRRRDTGRLRRGDRRCVPGPESIVGMTLPPGPARAASSACASVTRGEAVRLSRLEVVGVRLTARVTAGATPPELLARLTSMLRGHGGPDKFVEFCGPGLDAVNVAARLAVTKSASACGASTALFPVDGVTLDHLRATGRDEHHVRLVATCAREQGLLASGDAPERLYSSVVTA
jgi:hypothetical protein